MLPRRTDEEILNALLVLVDADIVNIEELKYILLKRGYAEGNVNRVLKEIGLRINYYKNMIKLDDILLNPSAAILRYKNAETTGVA